jgi:phosphate/sulfate permease
MGAILGFALVEDAHAVKWWPDVGSIFISWVRPRARARGHIRRR